MLESIITVHPIATATLEIYHAHVSPADQKARKRVQVKGKHNIE